MPRVFTVLAVLIPVFSVLWVCRSFIPVFDVVASLPLSWPLAVHPDNENSQQAYDEGHSDDAGQIPLQASDFVDHHRPKQHGHVPVAAHTDSTKGQFTRKIVAVGDLHGDMPNALEVLQMAGVVDENGDWSGEVDFFVQTGDIID
ncbi:hypothetical protein K466DRAFT_607036, partial [Polyporus arcularius HHB13444]